MVCGNIISGTSKQKSADLQSVERVRVRLCINHHPSTIIQSNTHISNNPTNQPVNQTTNQTNQRINQPIKPSTTSPSINHAIDQQLDESVNQSIHSSIHHPSVRSCMHPSNHLSIYQLQTSKAMFSGDGLEGIRPARPADPRPSVL